MKGEQPSAERGESQYLSERNFPLSLILLLNEAKSFPLPQGARVIYLDRCNEGLNTVATDKF